VSTQTVTRPEVDERETSQGPEVFHYGDKTKIVEGAVLGTYVKTLCGLTLPVRKVPKPGSPVCPECKAIYDDDAQMAKRFDDESE
jgi:hypothetical protein